MKPNMRLILVLIVLLLPSERLFPQWIQTNGPYGAEVNVIAMSGIDVLAGTQGAGVFLSSDGGTTWKSVGLSSEEGVYCLLSIPRSGSTTERTWFAGVSGRVLRTTDRGLTWQPQQSGLPGAAVVALCTIGNALLAGTTTDGIFRSTDNGLTWVQANTGLTVTEVTALLVKGTTVYAGTWTYYGGFYRSTDGGLHWSEAINGLTDHDVTSLATDGKNIFAGTHDGGVFRTSDDGNNWTPAFPGIENQPVTAIAAQGTAVLAGVFGSGVFVSSDTGTTWSQSNWGLSDTYVRALLSDGQSVTAGTMNGIFRSNDKGKSWSTANNGLVFWPVNAMAITPDGSTLLVGTTGGGIYRTIDYGSSWWDAPNGNLKRYNGGTFSAYAFAAQGSTVFAGTNGDSLVYCSYDNGVTWIGGYDGLPNQNAVTSILTLGNWMLAGTGGGGVYRSTNGGKSWMESFTGMPGIAGVRSLVRSGPYVFAGTYGPGVFRSTDDGLTWVAKNSGLSENFVKTLAVKSTASGANTLIAGCDGGMFRSTDNGNSWTQVVTGLPQRANVSTVAIVGDDAYAGYDGSGIFKSSDDGLTWSAFNDGLTDLKVNALTSVQNGKAGATIFAGTETKGVFRFQTPSKTLATVAPAASAEVIQGAPFWVEVRVGDPVAVKGLYGISLKLKSRQPSCTYVEGSATVGTFLGPGPLTFYRTVDKQTIDLAVTKSASQGVDGKGIIAKAQFVSSATGLVEFSVFDIQAVTSSGTAIVLDTMGASVKVISSTPMLVPVAVAPNETGQPFWVEVRLGENVPAKGLYGVSFKLKSDNSACSYVSQSGVAGSILGGNPVAFFQSSAPGVVDVGVSRSSPPGVDGKGVVARVQFQSAVAGTFRFSIFEVMAVDQAGNPLALDTASTTVTVSSQPLLTPSMPNQVSPGSPFWVEARIGDNKAVTGLYGISFKLKSNSPMCTYVEGSAVSGSFLGTGQLFFFRKIDPQTIDASTSRAAGPGVNGSGVVVRTQFIASTTGTVTFSLSDVTAIDAAGNAIPLSTGSVSVKVAIGGTTDVLTDENQPQQFALRQNYPNPFNPTTTISFVLPKRAQVLLHILDVLGREIVKLAEDERAPGTHEFRWDAAAYPSGIYFCRFQTGEFVQTRKMLLLK